MSVLTRPAAPTHRLPGAEFTSLATPTLGSVETAVWEVRLSPGHPGAPHQLTHQEVFVVLAGCGSAELDGQRVSLESGDTLVVPAHTPFLLEAAGDADFVALCCMPVGGQAQIEGTEPFTPPSAQ